VQPGDSFDVTPVIIGLIRDPKTGEIIFNPVGFDPVTDTLPEETRLRILQAIVDSGDKPLHGIAYVSKGVSYATTIFGGNGNDTFNVYRNVEHLAHGGRKRQRHLRDPSLRHHRYH